MRNKWNKNKDEIEKKVRRHHLSSQVPLTFRTLRSSPSAFVRNYHVGAFQWPRHKNSRTRRYPVAKTQEQPHTAQPSGQNTRTAAHGAIQWQRHKSSSTRRYPVAKTQEQPHTAQSSGRDTRTAAHGAIQWPRHKNNRTAIESWTWLNSHASLGK